jgi:hypothetical protein
MGKTSQFLGEIICPRCGLRGHLQRFKRRYFSKRAWGHVYGKKWYYRVTHYSNLNELEIRPDFKGKYKRTCYLSKQNIQNIITNYLISL